MPDLKRWLPLTKKEVELRGWEQLDVVLITGDAYVDHPAFGTAIIGRTIEQEGFKVGIIAQPNWRDDLRDFRRYGKPKFFFGINSGSMDSMVNHYTAAKRLRSTDAYTPGNVSGFRPDYATTVYSRIVRQLFPESLIFLGGIEASLRRLTHYDYWSDSLMPSILEKSNADLLTYGMGEQSIRDILHIFKQNEKAQISDFYHLPQIAYKCNQAPSPSEDIQYLHSYQSCLKSKEKFAHNFKLIETESNKKKAKTLVEPNGDSFVIVNPPYDTISRQELDAVYDLPFTRLPHPKYEKRGDIPAFLMIQNSITIHRGCFGACSFCTISAHQGKFISSRSQESIIREIEKLTQMPYFKGHISDLGGPSANMYNMKGIDETLCQQCSKASCIYPNKCNNLNFNHQPLLDLYHEAAKVQKVKKITIGSGVRYDLLLCDNPQTRAKYKLEEYCKELIVNHVSGRLKVAPEHTEAHVLTAMRKPHFDNYLNFKTIFDNINQKYGLRQQLIAYFISSHPACTLNDMVQLSQKIKKIGFKPEQVQDFTPTPMTLSSTIFYTGIDPYSGKKIFCATKIEDKKKQNQLFFDYKNKPKNNRRPKR